MLTQVDGWGGGGGGLTRVGGGWERHHGNGLLSPLQRLSLESESILHKYETATGTSKC